MMKTVMHLLIIFLTVLINNIRSDVTHLTWEDAQCFPLGFNFELEEQEFVHLLVIPYLDIKSIEELSNLQFIPIDNGRYNDFLSCMWKNKMFQLYNGTIDYKKIERALSASMGRDVGDTGPGIHLSNIEAARIVSVCRDLGGYSHGQRVVILRNCILRQIKNFVRKSK
ncbi:hypothetical protein FQR65_LT07890 [Abscondita terminalis]|nr:hypothetical protein FQR65_LT07890 [Abscondita terminalis]